MVPVSEWDILAGLLINDQKPAWDGRVAIVYAAKKRCYAYANLCVRIQIPFINSRNEVVQEVIIGGFTQKMRNLDPTSLCHFAAGFRLTTDISPASSQE